MGNYYQIATTPKLYVSYPLWQYSSGALDSVNSNFNVPQEDLIRMIQLDPSKITSLYPIAGNHLEAKFSLQAVLAMVALQRRAGKGEFRDEFVQAEPMQDMQKRIETRFDPDIEALGFDKMRSRIHIRLRDANTVTGDADERYRGGPENPLTDDELKDKARSCCEGVLAAEDTERLIDAALGVSEMEEAALLADYLRVSP